MADTFQPHEPWTPPRRYIDLYPTKGHRGPEPSTALYLRTADWLSRRRAGPVLERMRDLYAAEVTMTDHWLGVFLERLRWLGLEGNTVIALVSDHGILLGEHGWTGKIASMLHPPLDARAVHPGEPGEQAPWRDQRAPRPDARRRPHVAVARRRGAAARHGRARPARLSGARKLAYGGYANWHYARTDEIAYVGSNRGRGRRLYDLERDPREERNLAHRHPKRIDALYAHRRTARRRPPAHLPLAPECRSPAAASFRHPPQRLPRPHWTRARSRRRPTGPNVVLFIVDSLRADAVYDDWARTPNMDALRRHGLSFVNVHPEAMPTVPARNSILGGRRMFPFRGWHDRRGLLAFPGWSPLTHVDASLTSAFRKGGYYTSYVTDNPFLGFSVPYAPVRNSVHRFIRTGGQIGGNKPVSSVPAKVLDHWLHHSINPRERRRVGLYLANCRVWESPDNSYAARVFRHAIDELDRAAAHRAPFFMVVDTYEPHEPWTPPKRYLERYGDHWRGPEPSMPLYTRTDKWLAPRRAGRRPAPDEGAVRGRGHDDRRLDRPLPRPAARPEARARHRRRARRGPRHPPGRARLDRARSRPRSTRRSRASR